MRTQEWMRRAANLTHLPALKRAELVRKIYA